MKIEKVNDNQIRCTLTKEDLASRQMRLSELAYGSEKAKSLFQDMIQQANYEFGFEVEDLPLMVEAIPLTGESIVLVITKVEYPEELDTRFSRFTEPEEGEYDEAVPVQDVKQKGADDILDIFRKFKELVGNPEEKAKTEDGKTDEIKDAKKSVLAMSNVTRMYTFSKISHVEELAKVLSGYYVAKNHLYKDNRDGSIYLVMKKGDHTPEEFNKICNITSEYGSLCTYTDAAGAYLAEHGSAIILDSALQTLATL